MRNGKKYLIKINEKEIPFIQAYNIQIKGKSLIVKDFSQPSTMSMLIDATSVLFLKHNVEHFSEGYKETQEKLDSLDRIVDLLNFSFGLLELRKKELENREVLSSKEHEHFDFEEELRNLFVNGKCNIANNIDAFCQTGIKNILHFLTFEQMDDELEINLNSFTKKVSESAQVFMQEIVSSIEV